MLPRMLFVTTIAFAGILAVAVLIAPWLSNRAAASDWDRLIALFAEDTTVRRTALASAVGMVATACVFFRPKKPARSETYSSRSA